MSLRANTWRNSLVMIALLATASSAGAQTIERNTPPGLSAHLSWPEDIFPAPSAEWRQQSPGPHAIDTATPAVPGAHEVLHDTPNVFVWSRYQTGSLGGWTYRLFPDGSAIVVADDGRVASEYLLKCRSGVSCQISNDSGEILSVPAIGAPKPQPPDDVDGLSMARFLAEWILAGTGTPPPPPPPPPDPVSEPAEPVVPEVATVEVAEAPLAEETEPNLLLAPVVECTDPDPFYPDSCTFGDEPPGPAPLPASPQRQTAAPPSVPARSQPAIRSETARPEPQTLAEKYKLACSISTGAGLQYNDHVTQEKKYGKFRVSLGCNAQLTERVKLSMALIQYPLSDQQAPWDPDFTYAMDIRVTDKLSLSYSNYSARFSGGGSNLVSSLLEGSLRASYKLPSIPIPYLEGRKLNCSIGLGLSDPSSDAATLFCHSSITDKLWAGVTLYAYPADAQEPWNPDYSYMATYKINDRMALNYSNFSSNRWPWNRGSSPGPGILGGSLSLSYKLIF
ncbi:hypothetical protein [Paracoccus seriniphilus]|uniref:Uncharacterized protein n=1 Tax=Paracoccus seriniphilus TaxID=184748 RepID=A0A239PU33_9RHOB|nr:hypothetical protein [Paracoccus seriniphilus]WCR16254.1 hypothetical protein JHW44_19490 [Paracoccus seriniphilus]SNT73809.1 hypothetical protein SAMN05444959_105255 [Paracoccus seriniphilus]